MLWKGRILKLTRGVRGTKLLTSEQKREPLNPKPPVAGGEGASAGGADGAGDGGGPRDEARPQAGHQAAEDAQPARAPRRAPVRSPLPLLLSTTRRILKLRALPFGTVLDLRTATSQKCEGVSRSVRI